MLSRCLGTIAQTEQKGFINENGLANDAVLNWLTGARPGIARQRSQALIRQRIRHGYRRQRPAPVPSCTAHAATNRSSAPRVSMSRTREA
jgi:hypothetical protein